MVPVDYVARIIVASAFCPPQQPLGVVQINGRPRLRFVEYLAALKEYGYPVREVDYPTWRDSLEEYVDSGSQEQHAL